VSGVDEVSTGLLSVSLSRQERGLLKMSLLPQPASPVQPGYLLIADMFGTGIAISDKLQVVCRYHGIIQGGA